MGDPRVQALERIDLVAKGASPFDIYGTEWALDPTFAFRRDLRVLIEALLDATKRAVPTPNREERGL